MDKLENLGINDLSQAYLDGATRPTEVVACSLERIEKHESKLGAFELVMADQLMEVMSKYLKKLEKLMVF